MKKFEISESLKGHYLYNKSLSELLDLYMILFNKEKKEMMRIINGGAEKLHGTLNFSQTVYSISDIIVHKYFNSEFSYLQMALLRSIKYKTHIFY